MFTPLRQPLPRSQLLGLRGVKHKAPVAIQDRDNCINSLSHDCSRQAVPHESFTRNRQKTGISAVGPLPVIHGVWAGMRQLSTRAEWDSASFTAPPVSLQGELVHKHC